MSDPMPTLGQPVPGLSDENVRALDRYARQCHSMMRELGLLLDQDPDAITGYLDRPEILFAQYGCIPPRYRPALATPPELDTIMDSCAGTVALFERLSHGDPNVILANPGPALSGEVIRVLADEKQADRYFGRLAGEPVHTFFGLTEPDKGSAATELGTTLTRAPDGDGWLLNGEKCYIGNGARAQLGVVFCRRAPGPLGVEAVLVDTDQPGFGGELLATVGLRGARISRLRFDNVRIPEENLLGAHLPPTRRGLRGAMRVLYRARPGIAAMAIGCAQAAVDHLGQHRPHLGKVDRYRLEGVLDRLAAVRRLNQRNAVAADEGRANIHRVAAVKAQAAHVAEEATLLVAELLGPASLVEHPWLEKTYRDVRAFEIMEGPTNLHRLSVFQGVLKDTFLNRHPTDDASLAAGPPDRVGAAFGAGLREPAGGRAAGH